ncbi:MAG: hypothetical protein ACLQF1_22120, partial [Methyloceanibacter sp.]
MSLLVVAVSLAARTHERSGDIREHYAEFVAPPDGDAVEVCHAYTCRMKTTFYFHQEDINEIVTTRPSRSAAPSPTPSPISK